MVNPRGDQSDPPHSLACDSPTAESTHSDGGRVTGVCKRDQVSGPLIHVDPDSDAELTFSFNHDP
eukprot:1008941-Rhodomonas_salina.2